MRNYREGGIGVATSYRRSIISRVKSRRHHRRRLFSSWKCWHLKQPAKLCRRAHRGSRPGIALCEAVVVWQPQGRHLCYQHRYRCAPWAIHEISRHNRGHAHICGESSVNKSPRIMQAARIVVFFLCAHHGNSHRHRAISAIVCRLRNQLARISHEISKEISRRARCKMQWPALSLHHCRTNLRNA